MLRFVSQNAHKAKEVEAILAEHDLRVEFVPLPIDELQTTRTDVLVRHKALEAFRRVGRPLFVEHTGLYIEDWERLPGGLTQQFVGCLQSEGVGRLFGSATGERAEAITVIGLVDGKAYRSYEGRLRGRVIKESRGTTYFGWDTVFMPDGHSKTLAELGLDIKNRISMRRRALEELMRDPAVDWLA